MRRGVRPLAESFAVQEFAVGRAHVTHKEENYSRRVQRAGEGDSVDARGRAKRINAQGLFPCSYIYTVDSITTPPLQTRVWNTKRICPRRLFSESFFLFFHFRFVLFLPFKTTVFLHASTIYNHAKFAFILMKDSKYQCDNNHNLIIQYTMN